jgi:hypothetical protein
MSSSQMVVLAAVAIQAHCEAQLVKRPRTSR